MSEHVDDETAVGRAVTGAAVAAAANGELEAGRAGQGDRLRDVVGVGDPDDGRRPGVDATERDRPCLVVVGVVGGDDTAGDGVAQVGDGAVRGGRGHRALLRARVGGASPGSPTRRRIWSGSSVPGEEGLEAIPGLGQALDHAHPDDRLDLLR